MQTLKTGALIRGAAEGAAIAAGASEQQVRLFAQFGHSLGLLFQLTDDLLDRAEDLAEGGNNILHHIDDAALLERIETVSEDARAVLAKLGPNRAVLNRLVDRIAQRTV